MSVTIDLAPETERRLQQKAAEKGQTIEEYLKQLAEASAGELPAANQITPPPDMTPEERVAAFRAWVASHRPGTGIVDDSRESIYEGDCLLIVIALSGFALLLLQTPA